MFDDVNNADELACGEDSFEILQELERNTPDAIRRQRANFRFQIKAPVTLQPGNASEILEFKVQGTTGDVSESGLGALFPIPVCVGDIYRLQFDRSQLDLPLTFARCVRCVLVRENAFSAGFRFFSNIAMPKGVAAESTASAGS